MKHFALLFACLCLGLPTATTSASDAHAPGSSFKDCPVCPEMVVIPPGKFMMGSEESGREKPIHPVSISYTFAVGKFDVTFDEWDACFADGGCGGNHPDDRGWGRGTRPVMDVSWNDAENYVSWLSKKTGKTYRLLSEAEMEYVTRAGSTTRYWWGDDIGSDHANCYNCGGEWANRQTAPSGSFKPNPFGLYDTAGNLTVWVEDPWHPNYEGAPEDGSVWQPGDPERKVMRNGSWFNRPVDQRSSYRNGDSPKVHNAKIGFRVARAL
jgi:formylglycine-generating enzyme required for sulfatase activity